MCYNQTGDISTLEGTPLKLVDKFNYLGSSVESTEKDIETRLTKAWTAINRLSIIWKSDLTDKMKRSFFQAAVTSILLYGCTTWTLTKRLEKKLDGNYTRMLRAILNKSWRQHPTRHQLYDHLPPITKTIQVRRTRHAGHCWRSRDELLWSMAAQKQVDQHERTFSSYVRIRDVVLKTYLGRWTIGRSGERGSGISVLPARYDDDDERCEVKVSCHNHNFHTNQVFPFGWFSKLITNLQQVVYLRTLYLQNKVCQAHLAFKIVLCALCVNLSILPWYYIFLVNGNISFLINELWVLPCEFSVFYDL